MDQNSQNIVKLWNNLAYVTFNAIFEFLEQDAYIIFHFEIEHKKNVNFWLGVWYPLNDMLSNVRMYYPLHLFAITSIQCNWKTRR